MDSTSSDQRRKEGQLLLVIICIITAITFATSSLPQFDLKRLQSRKRDSAESGKDFVNGTLKGHPKVFQEEFLMKKRTFLRLCYLLSKAGLKDSIHLQVREQVAIFLWITGHNESNRGAQRRFQHSAETISRYFYAIYFHCLYYSYFNKVLDALLRLSPRVITLPTSTTALSPRIGDDQCYSPYFNDCIGAIDGCHIQAHIKSKDQTSYRNR